MPENKGTKDQNPSDLPLMTWLFNRRLAIEPYGEQNLKACCQKKDSLRVSTWVLFKVFLNNLHPMISLSAHHDISVRRFDRMIVFFIKTLLVFELCHFSLSNKALLDLDPNNFLSSPSDELAWEDSNEGQVILVLLMSIFILMPLPSCCFNIARSKYRIKIQVLS